MGEVDNTENASDVAVIDLPGKLDSAAAGHLHDQLSQFGDRNVALNFAAVEQIGGHCLQVLMNLAHHWALKGQTVALIDLSDQLAANLKQVGVTPAMLHTGG